MLQFRLMLGGRVVRKKQQPDKRQTEMSVSYPAFPFYRNCDAIPIKRKSPPDRMRTRAKKKNVASDRARRESFAGETLCYVIRKEEYGFFRRKD